MGSGSSCSPLEVRSALCSVLPQFNNDSQQDAQELLLLLLNTLHDDFNKVLLNMFGRSTLCAQTDGVSGVKGSTAAGALLITAGENGTDQGLLAPFKPCHTFV